MAKFKVDVRIDGATTATVEIKATYHDDETAMPAALLQLADALAKPEVASKMGKDEPFRVICADPDCEDCNRLLIALKAEKRVAPKEER